MIRMRMQKYMDRVSVDGGREGRHNGIVPSLSVTTESSMEVIFHRYWGVLGTQ